MKNTGWAILFVIIILGLIIYVLYKQGILERWGIIKPSKSNERLNQEYCFKPVMRVSGREEGGEETPPTNCTDQPAIFRSMNGDTSSAIKTFIDTFGITGFSGDPKNYVKMCKDDFGRFVYAPLEIKNDSAFRTKYCDPTNTKLCGKGCETNK